MARLRAMAVSADPPPSVVLLDASAVTNVDVTAVEAFEQLHDDLAVRGIELWVANLEGRALDLGSRQSRWAAGQDRSFPTLDAAVESFGTRS